MTQRSVEGSVVLVTGGTGSFGSTLTNYLLTQEIAEVRILSRDEAKQDAMRHAVNDQRVRFFVGDTRDAQSISRAMKGVDLVFHAAALKQVPTAEFFPLEAIKTNINGSANVLHSAIEHSVSSVVCLSTDKAVYPINAMGMTKALMEKTAQAFARDSQDSVTTIAVTRYGNVMYSRGSVIPRFVQQIRNGEQLTITSPLMTRFLMSLADSVDLVNYAFTNATTGDLFVRKAPAATIVTLAQALSELMNTKLNYRVIGVRHGEKLFESLLSAEEMSVAEDRGEYFRVPLDTRDLNYAGYFDEGEPKREQFESYTSESTQQLGLEEVKQLLLSLPELRGLLHP